MTDALANAAELLVKRLRSRKLLEHARGCPGGCVSEFADSRDCRCGVAEVEEAIWQVERELRALRGPSAGGAPAPTEPGQTTKESPA